MKNFKLQKRACRVILDYNVEDSNEAMQSLKILSVYDRLFLTKAKFIFKVYHDLTPTYISENYVQGNEMEMSIQLRSSAAGCFVPPRPKRECFNQSMRYSVLYGTVYQLMLKGHRQAKHFTIDVLDG